MAYFNILLFLIGFAVPIASFADTFYVDPAGNDSNPGTSARPFRTIAHAVKQVSPGDTVLVRNGVYREKVIISRSGTPDRYIVLKAVNQGGAKVEVAETGKTDGIKIAANYVTVDGFEVYDPNPGPGRTGNCITVWENHHVNILNNRVHGCGAAGIQVGRCDHILIENNVAYGNAKYNPSQSSGIGLYQARSVDNAPGYHIIVRNNRSYDNINLVFASFKPGETTDGNGIILDNFYNEGDTNVKYPHRTLIENNLIYNNGGKGLHVFKSDHVDVFNNTVYHNNKDTQSTATWRGELSLVYSKDTVWRNNIGVAKPGAGVLSWNRALLIARSEEMVWEKNLSFDGTPGNESINFSGTSVDLTDLKGNLLGVSPGMNDPQKGKFDLRADSPALDAGSNRIVSFWDIDYKTRNASSVDIGAFEHGGILATGIDPEPPQVTDLPQATSYPNPFSGEVTVTYHLSRPAPVRLEIFNALGQHMATVVDAEKPTGEHTAHFSGSHLPNGVYYYRIFAGNATWTKAMILAR
ncbi:MAG: right-handed parallel beta-helix repeat-containing protein [Rhodothermales bacterium]|nr:right-handed parallel beta-helix repeat-containing protein [Rhodothermales bacterium]